MAKLELNAYSPSSQAITIYVRNNPHPSDISEEVEKIFTNVAKIYLLKADTVKWCDSGDTMLHQLKQHNLDDRDVFKPLTRHALKEWIGTIHDHDDDLHIVVTRDQYPIITVLDMNALQVHANPDIRGDSSLAKLIPAGRRYTAYKPRERIVCPLEPNAVAELADSLVRDSMEKVNIHAVLNSISPWGFVPGDVHFVIYPADVVEEALPPLPYFKQRREYFANTPSKAPSSEGTPEKWSKTHQDSKRRIYCGRPDHLSTPPSLLDETLCQLRSDLDSITPTPKDIQCYDRLREVAVQFYSHEDKRRDKFTACLAVGGILPDTADPTHISGYTNDGALLSNCLRRLLPYYIQEIRNELSAGGAEPSFEAILYHLEYVRPIVLNPPPEETAEWEKINFPVILVMHFGPYLAIAAATYTVDPNVELLCCIPLHVHPTNITQLAAGERALAALRVALHSLRSRYPTLHTTRRTPGLFPFRDFYYEDDDKGGRHKFEFTYVEVIDGKRIFRAKLEDGSAAPLCVKFCTRYSADAHRTAHRAGFAPALRAVNDVYGWTMVVMDDVSADYSNTLYDLHEAQKGDKRTALLVAEPAVSIAAARAQVKEKLVELHNVDYVHGDVRSVNVLVRNKNAPPGPDVLLVDFDWAGREGETTYPRGMNREISRPDGAAGGEKITRGHDVWMAEQLY